MNDMLLKLNICVERQQEYDKLLSNQVDGHMIWNNQIIAWGVTEDEIMIDFLKHFFIEGEIKNNKIAKDIGCSYRQLQRFREKYDISQSVNKMKYKFIGDIEHCL